MTGKPRRAIFPVGGLGTRFLPATKAMPKEMLPVVDKPLIQYAVEEARAAGFEQLILVTSRGKSLIEDHFDHSFELHRSLESRGKTREIETIAAVEPEAGTIAYVRQPQALGLGQAVWCARELVADEPFAVLLPDDLILAERGCLAQMMDLYGEVGGNLIAVEDVPREHTDRYGVLDVESDDGTLARANGVVEKPKPEVAPSTLSVIGRYILHPDVMDRLGRQTAGAGGEIQLTDAIAATLPAVPLHGFRFQGKRFDCGSKAGFLEANVAFALERRDLGAAMRAIVDRYAEGVRA